MEAKCRSLRFEDKEPCLGNSQESSGYCQHHGELALCLFIINQSVDSFIEERNLCLSTQEDLDSIKEVQEKMRCFHKSITNPSGSGEGFWWLRQQQKKPRRRGYCQSLELRDGTLCTEAVSEERRFCRRHHIQEQVICEAYHLKLNMEGYGISKQTIQFAEFMLRREHNQCFIIKTDTGHQIRFGTLYKGLFKHPYPQENAAAIDEEFYAEAKKFSGAAERMFRSSVKRSFPQFSYDDSDENEDNFEDNFEDNYMAESAPKRVAVCNEPEEEDWD